MEDKCPEVSKNIWDLKLFDHAIIEIDSNTSYQLMRVPLSKGTKIPHAHQRSLPL